MHATQTKIFALKILTARPGPSAIVNAKSQRNRVMVSGW